MAELSAEDLATLAGKVSSFMDGLAEPERDFLADVLATAGLGDRPPEVEGFGLNSDRTQMGVLANEQAINSQQLGVSGTNDRRRASLDNIQKFLDILRSANPKF